MGAVNRCWRCGRAFAATPTVAAAPPLRRAPIDGPLDVPPWIAASLVIAQVVEVPHATDSASADVVAEVASSAAAAHSSSDWASDRAGGGASDKLTGESSDKAPGAVRRGSPFADGHVPAPDASRGRRIWQTLGQAFTRFGRKLRRERADDLAAAASASGPVGRPLDSAEEGMSIPTLSSLIGLILGIVSLVLLGFPMIAVFVGVLGLVFAAVGLAGRSFGIVIVALLVCCLSTGLGVYRVAMQTYEAIYGPSEYSEEDEFEPYESPNPEE